MARMISRCVSTSLDALTGVIWLIGIVRRLGTQLASSLCPKPSVPINQMTPAFNIWAEAHPGSQTWFCPSGLSGVSFTGGQLGTFHSPVSLPLSMPSDLARRPPSRSCPDDSRPWTEVHARPRDS
ncbi:hypothetical protein TYRP_007725 [Tyrophagus putrescentiae]|nr:hypothetical protein TYRP_007725 [Tyrophagus putrescentiae]